MVLADVANAFNSLDWGVVLGSLAKRNISAYLRRIPESYLHKSLVVDDEDKEHMVIAGALRARSLDRYSGTLPMTTPYAYKCQKGPPP